MEDVTGDFCPACHEVILDFDECARPSAALLPKGMEAIFRQKGNWAMPTQAQFNVVNLPDRYLALLPEELH